MEEKARISSQGVDGRFLRYVRGLRSERINIYLMLVLLALVAAGVITMLALAVYKILFA